jgi:hypothetical protein
MTDVFIIEHRSTWEALHAMLLCPFSVFIDLPVWVCSCVWVFKGTLQYAMKQEVDLTRDPYLLVGYIVRHFASSSHLGPFAR